MSKRKFIEYKAGFKYQLHKTYVQDTAIYPSEPVKTRYISLSMEGKLHIHYGYAYDGPSGPTIDTKSSMRGALVHDAFYQLMRMGLLDRKWKAAIDKLFESMLVQDKMCRCRARIWYRGVQKLAGDATLAENVKKVHTAPKFKGKIAYLGRRDEDGPD